MSGGYGSIWIVMCCRWHIGDYLILVNIFWLLRCVTVLQGMGMIRPVQKHIFPLQPSFTTNTAMSMYNMITRDNDHSTQNYQAWTQPRLMRPTKTPSLHINTSPRHDATHTTSVHNPPDTPPQQQKHPPLPRCALTTTSGFPPLIESVFPNDDDLFMDAVNGGLSGAS